MYIYIIKMTDLLNENLKGIEKSVICRDDICYVLCNVKDAKKVKKVELERWMNDVSAENKTCLIVQSDFLSGYWGKLNDMMSSLYKKEDVGVKMIQRSSAPNLTAIVAADFRFMDLEIEIIVEAVKRKMKLTSNQEKCLKLYDTFFRSIHNVNWMTDDKNPELLGHLKHFVYEAVAVCIGTKSNNIDISFLQKIDNIMSEKYGDNWASSPLEFNGIEPVICVLIANMIYALHNSRLSGAEILRYFKYAIDDFHMIDIYNFQDILALVTNIAHTFPSDEQCDCLECVSSRLKWKIKRGDDNNCNAYIIFCESNEFEFYLIFFGLYAGIIEAKIAGGLHRRRRRFRPLRRLTYGLLNLLDPDPYSYYGYYGGYNPYYNPYWY